MALSKTFAFLSNTEGFSYSGTGTASWNGSDGQPAGCIQVSIDARNATGIGYYTWEGTWEALGIPPNSIVYAITGTTWSHKGTSGGTPDLLLVGPVDLANTSDVSQGNMFTQAGSVHAWTQASGSMVNVPTALRASSTTIRIRVYFSLDNPNSRITTTGLADQLIFSIDYNPPAKSSRTAYTKGALSATINRTAYILGAGPQESKSSKAAYTSNYPIPILDNFNGSLSHWNFIGGTYTINNGRLICPTGVSAYCFYDTSYGANQAVAITFSTLQNDGGEVGLVLKSNTQTETPSTAIRIGYNHFLGQMQCDYIVTGIPNTLPGGIFAVTFTEGDVLWAQLFASKVLKVYKNNTLLATINTTVFPVNEAGGYVGVWTNIGITAYQFDDYGLKEYTAASGSKNVYLLGSSSLVRSSKFAYLSGSTSGIANQPAYLEGTSAEVDTQTSTHSFTHGSTDENSSGSAYLQGYVVAGYVPEIEWISVIVPESSTDIRSSGSVFLQGGGFSADSTCSVFLDCWGQELVPDTNGTINNWVTEDGGTDLYLSLADPSDTTYVTMSHVGLDDWFDAPLEDAGVIEEGETYFEWRAWRESGSPPVSMQAQLMQGDELIATDERILSETPSTFRRMLTIAERQSITSPIDLHIRFIVSGVS